jgi:hypothetical protein
VASGTQFSRGPTTARRRHGLLPVSDRYVTLGLSFRKYWVSSGGSRLQRARKVTLRALTILARLLAG